VAQPHRFGRLGPVKDENRPQKRAPDSHTGTDNFFIVSSFACEIDHLGI
jgi:hypothetical protein